MKTIIFSLVSASLLNLTFVVEATPQTQEDMKRISMMIVQGRPDTEILNAWRSLVTNNPKIDVDKSINTIMSTARQEAGNTLEAARKKTLFFKALNEQIGSEINSVRPALSRGEADYRPVPKKSFSLNPDATGRVVVRPAGTIPDPKNLSEYINLLEQQKSAVLKNIQTSESEEKDKSEIYEKSIKTLAAIQKQLYNDAMKILGNLKG